MTDEVKRLRRWRIRASLKRHPRGDRSSVARGLLILLVIPFLFAQSLGAADQPADYHRGLDLTGWPICSYRGEFGWLLGAYGDLVDYGDGAAPYRWRVQAQSVGTWRRMHDHFLALDLPRVGGSPLRLLVSAGYTDLPDDRYFGVGNAAPYQRAWETPGADGFRAPRLTYFRLRRPWARVTARVALAPPLSLVHGVQFEWAAIDASAGSLLASEHPAGADGGRHGFVFFGLLVDTRDSEWLPTRGTFTAMTVRAAGPFVAGEHWMGGGNWTARGFWSPLGRLVLAGRFSVDAAFGDVPLLELSAFRDVDPFQGLGGGTSMRGVPRRRFVGPLKVLANLEARWMPLTFFVWGQRFDLGGVLFADVGRVWSREDDGGGRLSTWVHASGGGGLRAAWDEVTLMRVDLGVSSEATTIDFVVGQMF